MQNKCGSAIIDLITQEVVYNEIPCARPWTWFCYSPTFPCQKRYLSPNKGKRNYVVILL